MRDRVIRAAVAGLVACAAARTARSQTIVGTVRDSASRAPLPGVVVSMLGDSNRLVTRGITNGRGQFRAVLSGEMRSIRLVRIGFRPREVPVHQSAVDTITLSIDMVSLPTMLEPVDVRANAHCPRRQDGPRAFALLQQARAGLLTTVLSPSTDPAAMRRLLFDRVMDGTGDRVVRHTVRVDSSDAAAASFFASRPAADFVRDGFMADSGGLQHFYAPDARVLLDDAFAAGYCFRIVGASGDRAHQIGLGFTPADHRASRIDVDGILWIDTLARSLRDIEFHYAGLQDAIMRLRPGGTVSFAEVSPGIVLVDRWALRLVGAVVDTVPNPREQGDPMARTTLYLRVVGGVLTYAAWPDGRRWNATLAKLVGRALRRDSTAARGAVIALVGAPYAKGVIVPDVTTPYRATVDSSGRFEIDDLVPGPYSAVALDPALESIQFELPLAFGFTADTIVVFGRVTTSGNVPLPHVSLSTSWHLAAVPDNWHDAGVYHDTGTDGLFFTCQATLGDTSSSSLRVRARVGDQLLAETTGRVTGTITVVPVRVEPKIP